VTAAVHLASAAVLRVTAFDATDKNHPATLAETVGAIGRDNAMRRYVHPKLAIAGYGWVNFHVMRRKHSSLMRELGVDPKIVADQQGHTLDVNLNVYTESSIESRIAAVETLGSALVD
jgi:integrase